MLTNLYLKNFRRHEELSLSFDAGVNGIFGSNYRGKSAILLAVGVAIGGPGWARGYDLVRRGCDNFEVQLRLEIKGKAYRVMRNKGGAKLHELVANGEKLLASQQGNVNAELGKLLGMPVDRWLELRFVRQKSAAAMFEAGASKLNLLVEELTSVRTITQVIDNLAQRVKTANTKLETLRQMELPEEARAKLELDIAGFVTARQDIERGLQEAEAQREEASQRLPLLAVQIKDHSSELEALQVVATRRAKLEQDLQLAVRQLDALVEPERSTEVLDAKMNELDELLPQWQEWIARAEEAERVLASAKRHLAKLGDRPVAPVAPAVDREDIVRRIGEAEAAASAALSAYKEAEQAEAAADRREMDLINMLEGGVCEACNRPMDGHDQADLDRLQAELDKIREDDLPGLRTARADADKADGLADTALVRVKAELIRADDAVKAHDHEVAGYKKQLAQYEAAAEEVAQAEAALAVVQADAPDVTIEQAKEEVSDITSQYRTLVREHTAAAGYESQKAQLQGKVKEAEQALDDPKLAKVASEEDLARRAAKLQQLTRDQAVIDQQLKDMGPQIERMRTQLKQTDSSLAIANDLREKQDQLASQVNQVAAEVFNAEGLRKYLRDNRSRYMQSAWDMILGRASTFVAGVTDGYIGSLQRTEEGSFQFIEGDEVCEVNMASGAQAAILGLGVQVALSETLPTALDVFLADEPTADMDEAHSTASLLHLAAVAKQVAVISHHRMDESICSVVNEI